MEMINYSTGTVEEIFMFIFEGVLKYQFQTETHHYTSFLPKLYDSYFIQLLYKNYLEL